MPEVPFEQLGPGQVGRLAYQVIGQDGPIFNPRNIRFMTPPAQGPEMSLPEVTTALAGLNLVATAGAVALSAATLQEVRRLQEKVDSVLFGIERLQANVNDIARRVERIDMRVAENSLREAMRHVLSRAVCSNEINLAKLGDLSNDFESIIESLSAPLYFNFGVRLATDVRDYVDSIYTLLTSIRSLVAHRHNIVVSGDPKRTVVFSPAYDYLRPLGLSSDMDQSILFSRLLRIFSRLSDSIIGSVRSRFTWHDSEDLAYFNNIVRTELMEPALEIFLEHMDGGVEIYSALPKDVFDGNPELVAERLGELSFHWLWRTDSGLLMRTIIEIQALNEGYVQTFWRHLSMGEGVSTGNFEVAGTLPTMSSC